MFLKRIQIEKFRVLENVDLQFEQNFMPTIFPLGSLNGGGKSTLLQLIFTLLHCSFDEEKHQYSKNLLANFPVTDKTTTLAKFDINHENEDFSLEFIVSANNFEDYDFNSFLDVKEIEDKLKDNKKLQMEYLSLLELEKKLNSSTRITPLLETEIRRNRKYREFYIMTRGDRDATLDDYKSLIRNLLNPFEEKISNDSNLSSLLKEVEYKKLQIIELLGQKDIFYITHLDSDRVLLCKTTVNIDFLTEISNKIYLAAPSIFIFIR